METTIILLLMSFLYFYTFAIPDNSYQRWRNKRDSINTSDYLTDANKSSTTVTPTTIRTTTSQTDVCNISTADDSSSQRNRRSIYYSISNATTTDVPSVTTIDFSILSPQFLNCSSYINIKPECFEKLSNGSVYVHGYNRLFDMSNHLIRNNLLFLCSDILDEGYLMIEKFSDNFRNVSLICSVISTACIILHIIMFVLVKKLRNLPGYCLLSLCLALVGAYLCLIIQFEAFDLINCTVLAMFMLYFFLASLFWMNVMAYDVWKSIRMATAKLRLTAGRPFIIQYARYCFYGWGIPLIIILTSIIIHYSAPEHSKFRLIFNDRCWFKYKSALTLYFAGPLFVLIGLNILFFAFSFFMISRATMNKSKSNNKGGSDLRSRFFLSLRLASVMGFMWIFGVIATITKQNWLWYLFSACSALQGVFIFFSFTISERARKACQNAFRKRKGSVMPTLTTSHQSSNNN